MISSSLHELIIADAYNRPLARFKYGDKFIGGNFNFDDYYSGVKVKNYNTIKIGDISKLVQDIMMKLKKKDLKFIPNKLKKVLIIYLKKETE